MMKYLNTFENVKVGVVRTDFNNLSYNDFILFKKDDIYHISKIEGLSHEYINNKMTDRFIYYIKYGSNIKYIVLTSDDILFASTRKKDVIDYLKILKNTDKYNL